MQVLARISYLLQAGVGPAAADSLMKILHATALGGNDMVSAICNTPGLVRCTTFHIVMTQPCPLPDWTSAMLRGVKWFVMYIFNIGSSRWAFVMYPVTRELALL